MAVVMEGGDAAPVSTFAPNYLFVWFYQFYRLAWLVLDFFAPVRHFWHPFCTTLPDFAKFCSNCSPLARFIPFHPVLRCYRPPLPYFATFRPSLPRFAISGNKAATGNHTDNRTPPCLLFLLRLLLTANSTKTRYQVQSLLFEQYHFLCIGINPDQRSWLLSACATYV